MKHTTWMLPRAVQKSVGHITETNLESARSCLQTLKGDAFVKQRKTSTLDSLSSLAVATNTDPQALKQANNLYSDHSLAGREHIFYPGAHHSAMLAALRNHCRIYSAS